VRNERLATPSFVKGHKRSQGCSSGEIGRQEEQMDAFGHFKFLAGMPACSIQHQQHALLRACPYSLSKVRQGQREDLRIHGWQQEPLGFARGWMHKAVDVEPLEAVLDADRRSRTFAHPDPT